MTTIPGYVLLLADAEDVTGKLAEQLGYAGIHVTLSQEEDCCVLSVPKDQEAKARALLAEYFTASSRERKDEDLENFQGNFLQKTPGFMSGRDRIKSRGSSAWIFLGMSALLLVQGIVFLVLGGTVHGAVWCGLCLLFLFFGLRMLKKMRELKRSAEEEEAFTKKVTDWFGGTYTAAGIDKMIRSAAAEEDEAELDIRRLECIRDYIRREFRIEDAAYLEYLTDRIFRNLYE